MMTLIFAVLLLALLFSWTGHARLAVTAIVSCLMLSIGLFLWEIYSPEYGFRMPWIQVDLIDTSARACA